MADSVEAGGNMLNRDGWVQVDCAQADKTRGIQTVTVSSSLTDLDGVYGPAVLYTEWAVAGAPDIPVLRDYLWDPHTADAKCEHLVPAEGER